MLMENNLKSKIPKAFADLIAANSKPDKELKYGAGETELVITIQAIPPVAKRIEAIELAADLLFSFEHGVDGYIPSLLNFAKKYAVLVCFTDIDFTFDLSDIWTLIHTTALYDDVVREVGKKAVAEFLCELNELVGAHKAARIHTVNISSVLDRLTAMVGGIGEQFKSIDLPKVLKGFSKLPKDLKGEDFIKQIISLTKGGA